MTGKRPVKQINRNGENDIYGTQIRFKGLGEGQPIVFTHGWAKQAH
jgi:hypothetical protein